MIWIFFYYFQDDMCNKYIKYKINKHAYSKPEQCLSTPKNDFIRLDKQHMTKIYFQSKFCMKDNNSWSTSLTTVFAICK